MLDGNFRLEDEIAASRSGRRTRAVSLIAVVAVLAGCQGLPDSNPKAGEIPPSGNELAVGEPGPVKGSDEITALDRPAARLLQTQLAELGFKSGPNDGIVGPQTTAAIKRYQRAHHLPATGEISSQFLGHLAATAANRTADAQPPANLDAEDFPTYHPGTTFVYSNDDVARVSDAEGAAVKWIRSDGTIYSAYRNFMLPWTNWASATQRGTATIAEAPDTLWPLREGAEVAFSANVTVQPRDDPDATKRRVDRWRCRNGGDRNITVPAGAFETLVFVCKLAATPAAPEVVRTWYYAKNVRHYVRLVESDPEGNTPQTIDLVAVRPGAPNWPPIVRAALGRAVVHALEAAENKSQMLWTSSGVSTRVAIEAKARFIAPDGKSCRRFTQIWSENDHSRSYHALACKTAAGTWQIPGLESNTKELLVTSGEIS